MDRITKEPLSLVCVKNQQGQVLWSIDNVGACATGIPYKHLFESCMLHF